jgi:hypothetical protein
VTKDKRSKIQNLVNIQKEIIDSTLDGKDISDELVNSFITVAKDCNNSKTNLEKTEPLFYSVIMDDFLSKQQ